MVAVFPNVCLWRRSYSQNWEVLTFICQYGLSYCIVSPSFLFYCFVKIWATWENFLANGLPPRPTAKNCPYAYGSIFPSQMVVRIWQIRPIFVFRICFLCKSDRQTDPCKLPFRSYIIISDTL